jgi:benzodiazapine receptor
MIFKVILFLVINFSALALGSLFTQNGVSSDWYVGLNKAPWTPPGWVFGAAWTSIMLFFSFYMAQLWTKVDNKNLLVGLYVLQLILNIGWNPSFFYFHHVLGGLIIISTLTLLVGYFLINYWSVLTYKSVLILPYFIWLLIATSLNGYILLKN